MGYQLNGRQVPEGMYTRASTTLRRGGKAFLSIPEHAIDEEFDKRVIETMAGKSYCANCDGSGHLILQVITGGPYPTPDGQKHITYHEGKWYVMETVIFTCPECHGAGVFSGQAARAD